MILIDAWGPHQRRREPTEDWDENANVIVVIDANDAHRAWECGDAPTREDYEAAADTLVPHQEGKLSMGREAVIRFDERTRGVWLEVLDDHDTCPRCGGALPLNDTDILRNVYDCGWSQTGVCSVEGGETGGA